VFYLAYHLHWSWSEIMNLDAHERRYFVNMLAERVEAENRSLDAWREKIKNG
jgi:hypothetical protein